MGRVSPNKSWLTLTIGVSITIIRVCIICLHKNGPRIAAVPLFPGLRRFPEGRGFKQWTGDDSKALMKVMSTYCQFRDRDAEHITRYIYQL
jgi:hypothetical protein